MTLQYYPDTRGQWRWRLIAENGKIIADSGEGYASKTNAKRAANDLLAALRNSVAILEKETDA